MLYDKFLPMKFGEMSLSVLQKWSVSNKQHPKILGMEESQKIWCSKVITTEDNHANLDMQTSAC